jgi:glycogen debranching enzyme
LENQGWKDSWDSVQFANGELARAPIAICEVQAYVYAALNARAHFATERDDHALARRLSDRAAALKRAFNRDFWLEEKGWYAMGLDRDKRPIDALTSNIGHCLWAGIVDEERAPVIAEQLLSNAMFSGWGVRTLATSMAGYNPVSYHNGSVWPHDNAICVAGLMRYGLVEKAHQVMKGVVAAAGFTQHRLPELFSGVAADDVATPVGYPTSCSPQAWAAAAPLLLLRSVLRFEPDVRNARLYLAPAIPEWVGRVRVEGIPIMDGRLSLEVDQGELRVLDVPSGLTIQQAPRRATA